MYETVFAIAQYSSKLNITAIFVILNRIVRQSKNLTYKPLKKHE